MCFATLVNSIFCLKVNFLGVALRNHIFFSLLLGLFSLIWSADKTAITISLEEMVDPGMAAYTKRAIEEASAKNPDYIFLEVNTFGGRLDAAFDIVDAITSVTQSKTIALVNQKAISAGALISLAADEMYMLDNTTIGDCAPIIQGAEGPQMLGEKIQSPLRAKFRGLAQKNNYNELLSMSMVSANLEVLKLSNADSTTFMQAHHYEELSPADKKIWTKKETLVREGELLTLTNQEAQEFGFSKGTIKDIQELYAKFEVQAPQKVEISWSEDLVRLLGQIAPILILLGFGALYIEIKTPGFGFFGIVGIICLALVFGGQHLAGAANHLAVILFVIGVLLVVVEMFIIPGTWMAGLAGVVCFIVALAMSMGGPLKSPDEFSLGPHFVENIKDMIYLTLGAAVFPIFFAKYVLPRIPARQGVILNETMEASHAEDLSLGYEIGQTGRTINLLKPTGSVDFNGKLEEVQAQSGYIDAGKLVRISSLQNHQIWVEEIK